MPQFAPSPLPTQGATTPPVAPPALDPTIVNLAKAIRDTETKGQKDPYTAKGGSGEFGAYQYTPDTWAADAKKYLGTDVPLASADKLQQNEVAYKKLADLKGQGYNVGQIASIWNSGSPDWEGKTGINKFGVKYDVPQYVDSVSKMYQSLKAGGSPTPDVTASTVQQPAPAPTADEAAGQQSGAWFPAATGDNPLIAGLKATGNMLPSAFNFAKGALSALNPLNTLKTLGQIPGAFSAAVDANGGSIGAALKNTVTSLPGEAYQALVPKAARELVAGDVSGAARDVANDPFGSIAPLVIGARGLAGAVDSATGGLAETRMSDYVRNLEENAKAGVPIPKGGTNFGGAIDSGVSRVAGAVTSPIDTIRSAFGRAPEAPIPGETLPKAVETAGKVLQGDTGDAVVGARVLGNVDTSGVKTYEDLSSALQNDIKSNLGKVDEEYAASKTKTRLANLGDTVTSDSGGVKASAKVNYVSEALTNLQELYFKTKDAASEARIKAVISRAKTQGLTAGEINGIAREYGTEFGSKAFSKRTGDPLTSVNAQAYENVRTGLKEKARSFLSTDQARALDRSVSDQIRVKGLVDNMAEKVNKLEQRVQKRNLLEKIGRAAGIAVDTVTGGVLKSFVQKLFFPSNVGLKTLNSMDLEAQLSKNLKTLNGLDGASDSVIVRTLTDMAKRANNLPNTNVGRVSVFGRQSQLAPGQ